MPRNLNTDIILYIFLLFMMTILFADFLVGKFFKHVEMESVIFIKQKHFKYGEYFAIHYPK